MEMLIQDSKLMEYSLQLSYLCEMAKIVLIETATDICSIGLGIDDELVALRETAAFNEHGKRITIFIQECLDQAGIKATDLDAIAISSGPGSFTSLRIGTATAKGLCYALGKPLLAMDTMQALVLAAIEANDDENTYYIPMIDARSMGVYYAVYNKKGKCVQALNRGKLSNETLASYQKIVCCGHAAEKYKALMGANMLYRPQIVNSARHLLPLAIKAYKNELWADLAYYEPNYLAPPNITISKKKKIKKLI